MVGRRGEHGIFPRQCHSRSKTLWQTKSNTTTTANAQPYNGECRNTVRNPTNTKLPLSIDDPAWSPTTNKLDEPTTTTGPWAKQTTMISNTFNPLGDSEAWYFPGFNANKNFDYSSQYYSNNNIKNSIIHRTIGYKTPYNHSLTSFWIRTKQSKH